jgi:prepilin-type N-terminal cleavage/methylation domain-containing protein
MSAKEQYHSGFTLLEVMVTLAIISALVLTAIPNFKPMMSSFRLQISTNLVKRQLLVAKVRAAANPRTHCGVYFDSTNSPQKTNVFFDSDGNYRYNPSNDTLYGNSIQLEIGIRFTSYTDSVIVFRGDGTTNTGFTIVISNGYKNDSVFVIPTGRIKVKRS